MMGARLLAAALALGYHAGPKVAAAEAAPPATPVQGRLLYEGHAYSKLTMSRGAILAISVRDDHAVRIAVPAGTVAQVPLFQPKGGHGPLQLFPLPSGVAYLDRGRTRIIVPSGDQVHVTGNVGINVPQQLGSLVFAALLDDEHTPGRYHIWPGRTHDHRVGVFDLHRKRLRSIYRAPVPITALAVDGQDIFLAEESALLRLKTSGRARTQLWTTTEQVRRRLRPLHGVEEKQTHRRETAHIVDIRVVGDTLVVTTDGGTLTRIRKEGGQPHALRTGPAPKAVCDAWIAAPGPKGSVVGVHVPTGAARQLAVTADEAEPPEDIVWRDGYLVWSGGKRWTVRGQTRRIYLAPLDCLQLKSRPP
jgi:hypothetical protein